MQLFTLFFLIFFPVIAVRVSRKVPAINAIIVCYASGILLGNVFPGFLLRDMMMPVAEGVVMLALPLLLFSSDFKKTLRNPGPVLTAYGLLIISVVLSSFVTFYLFRTLPDAALSTAMYSAVISGGTPNLNAVGVALGATEAQFVLLNGYDVILSGSYFFLLITVMRPLIARWLPDDRDRQDARESRTAEKVTSRTVLKSQVPEAGKALLLSVAVLGAVAGVSYLIFGEIHNLFVIIATSTAGIALSFIRKIRKMPLTFETGDYLLLIFALGMGYSVRLQELWESDLTGFALCAVLFALMLITHLILCKLFKVDAPHFIISSTAGVFGPPFIGPVAGGTGLRRLIAPGVAVAVVGHAFGTYLGVLLYSLLS